MKPVLWASLDPDGGRHVFNRRPENVCTEVAWATADGRATIHHGDCLDVMRSLPDGSVDAVVTDPPYGIGGDVVRGNCTSLQPLPSWDVADHAWVKEASRVVRDGGHVLAFCDHRQTGHLWDEMEAYDLRPRTYLLWVKNATPPNPRRCFQSAWEVAIWATKGAKYPWGGGALTPNVYFGEIVKHDRAHPTQKEIGLMRWVSRTILPDGGTVLDPFMGSGTTLVAALQEGCKGIGIEREAPYVEIAKARVAHEAAQGNLFHGATS